MAVPKLSQAATRALRAAADGTLGRNITGTVTIGFGGATVKELHVQQLTDLGYITDGRTTRYQRLYAITADGLAALPADDTADQLCPGCNADLGARSVTPSRKQPGWCDVCAPDKVTHLMLPGDFATFCGKSGRDISSDPDVTVNLFEPLSSGGSDTNCVDCARVLRDRNNRR